jgi:hypothetical protein
MEKGLIVHGPDVLVAQKKTDEKPTPEIALPRQMSAMIYRPFDRLLSQRKPVPTLFWELINKLNKFFSISKAVLVMHCPLSDRLKLIARWEPDCFKEGVAMEIPTADSVLHRALTLGGIFHEPAFGCDQGNNLERRILTSPSTRALAICPAVSDDTVFGLISLASPVEYAFEMLDEGRFVDVFERFGELLSEQNHTGIGQVF